MIELNKIYNEDCLEGMKKIPDNSIDFCCTDLPFGITSCAWDKKINLEKFWEQVNRCCKKNACVALFAAGDFLADLIISNRKNYRYKWVWEKNLGAGFFNAKKLPLSCHEDILIFYNTPATYNPQWRKGKPYFKKHDDYHGGVYSPLGKVNNPTCNDGEHYYPRNVIKFKVFMTEGKARIHSTQKPVDLIEYLIKTYTNEGETVLDACMGSGTTAIAAINTGRNFIGFELDENFYNKANERIEKFIAEKELQLF